MTGPYDRLADRLARLEQDGLRRRLGPLTPTGPTTAVDSDGHALTVFCSNDYLGLAHHPEVVAAYTGGGAGASRLISGDRPAHHALEDALGDWFGRPATLFNSGYNANLALCSTVLERGDTVASDALNHASIIDGLRLSRAERVVMPHGRAQVPDGARMVVVEGLYSMDGDRPQLDGLAGGGAWLAVDEAHAIGAIGPGGRGVAAAQGVEADFVVGTLGKALGTFGAFVVGPQALRDLFISQGRSFVYTTGLPEPVARAARVALRLADDGRRAALQDRVRQLRSGLADLGIPALGADHIVPLVLGDQAMDTSRALRKRGMLATGIRWPTVPRGTERLRITLSAAHTADQVDRLLDALDAVVPR